MVAFLAWFALLFTGRYPQGLYNFNVGFLRFTARAYAFALLQTEEWPPFGFEEDRALPDPGGRRSAARGATTAGRPASG